MARPVASSVSLLLRSLAAHQEVSAMQGLARFASSSEALEKRYSPNQFGREKPIDSSLLWMRKSPYVEALVWVSPLTLIMYQVNLLSYTNHHNTIIEA